MKVSTRSRKTPVPLVGMSIVMLELLTTLMEEVCSEPIVAVIRDAEQVKPVPVTVILDPGAPTLGATLDIVCPAKQCSNERKHNSTNKLTGNFKIISLRITKEHARKRGGGIYRYAARR